MKRHQALAMSIARDSSALGHAALVYHHDAELRDGVGRLGASIRQQRKPAALSHRSRPDLDIRVPRVRSFRMATLPARGSASQ